MVYIKTIHLIVNAATILETPIYLNASIRMHLIDDVSKKKMDLCVIDKETEEYWIGRWVFGKGHYDILFPKTDTKELLSFEIDDYNAKIKKSEVLSTRYFIPQIPDSKINISRYTI